MGAVRGLGDRHPRPDGLRGVGGLTMATRVKRSADSGTGGLLHGSFCRSHAGWVCNCKAQQLPLTEVDCSGCTELRAALYALLNESRGLRLASWSVIEQGRAALERTGGWRAT